MYVTLGATNHSEKERELHDYYATPPEAVKKLLKIEKFNKIWEPACGEGHISRILQEHGYNVYSSDKYDRNFGDIKDFLTQKEQWNGDIVTNPPYKYAVEFADHALRLIPENNKLAMLLKIQFLEGQKRNEFFKKNPPKRIYVFSKRIACYINGDFSKKLSSAVCYAWFVWEKGYCGPPQIFWI